MNGQPLNSADTDVDRILVVGSDQDEAVTTVIADGLTAAGFELARRPDEAQTAIVLVSDAAPGDDRWERTVASLAGRRLLPVRLGTLDNATTAAIPGELAELNMPLWDGDDPSSLARLTAALLFRPERQRQVTQAAVEARAWQSRGRPDASLCDDLDRIDEFQFLASTSAGNLGAPPMLQQYATASLRRMHARRIRRRVGGVVSACILVVVALLIIEVLREARTLGRQNRLSAISSGYGGDAEDTLRWRAVLAAAAVLDESNPDADIAAEGLRRLLALPHGIPVVSRIDHQTMTGAFSGTDDQLVIIEEDRANLELELLLFEPATGRSTWTMDLPGQGRDYAVVRQSPSGSQFIAFGEGGLVVADGASGRAAELVAGSVSDAGFVDHNDDGDKVWVLTDDGVATYDTSSGEVMDSVPIEGEVVTASMTAGGLRAVVTDSNGRPAIVAPFEPVDDPPLRDDGPSLGLTGTATIDPASGFAYIAADDRRVWMLEPDGSNRVLAIPAPDSTTKLLVDKQGRLTVASSSKGVEVYDLGSGLRLGAICTTSFLPWHLDFSETTDRMLCFGEFHTELWPMPPAPLNLDPPSFQGSAPDPDWLAFMGDNNTVGAFAVSRDGTKAVAGHHDGTVTLYDITPDRPAVAYVWSTPSGLPLVAATWDEGPVVFETGDRAWRVPICDDCSTNEGLVAAYRRGIQGCWLEEPLADVTRSARDALGLVICENR